MNSIMAEEAKELTGGNAPAEVLSLYVVMGSGSCEKDGPVKIVSMEKE